MKISRIKIEDRVILMLAVLSLFSLAFLRNGIYLVIAYLVLYIVIKLTWRNNIPNVFALIMVYHWLQIAAYIPYVNESWDGDLSFDTDHSIKAFICGLIGVLLMALIINFIAFKKIKIGDNVFTEALEKLNPRRVLNIYLLLYFIANVAGRFAFKIGGLTQIFLNIALLKWVGFMLLGFISFQNPSYRKYFIIAFIFEFAAGFFSYFSSFKDVFFYSAILLSTFVQKIDFKTTFRASLVSTFLFFIAITWTIVKGDYREYLNQGSRSQTVQVDQSQAFNRLSDLVSSIDDNSWNAGIGAFFYRLQYIYHFSKAMDMVPNKLPFQNGAVWAENISFVTVPRFLNPNKGILDASEKTTKFTGIQYWGAAQGTSISLGYFAEFYVDFGIPGMFFGLMILAFLWSYIFSFLIDRFSTNILINYSVVAAFFVQFLLFEKDGIYVIGRLYTTFIVFMLLKYTLLSRVEKYISGS